jgi:hypothetical protein
MIQLGKNEVMIFRAFCSENAFMTIFNPIDAKGLKVDDRVKIEYLKKATNR